MNEEEKAWLAGLKVGDEVAIDIARWNENAIRFKQVERASPTQVVVDGIAFRRSDGRQRGEVSKWSLRKRIFMPEIARKNIERYEAAKSITQKTKEAKARITAMLDQLPLNKLIAVEEFVAEKAGAEEEKWGVK